MSASTNHPNPNSDNNTHPNLTLTLTSMHEINIRKLPQNTEKSDYNTLVISPTPNPNPNLTQTLMLTQGLTVVFKTTKNKQT